MHRGLSLFLQSGGGTHLAGSGRTSIDVVIPSIRLDPGGMIDSLRMDVPRGVDLCYYIVSDNPAMESREFEYLGRPVHVMVNEENLGAALSRNVGMDAGSGTYVLFIDDDVDVPPGILGAYLAAIEEDPDAPGYVAPTVFPDPINPFTRGIRKSGMLHFFGRPESGQAMAWGTTSNLVVRRSAADGVRFSAAFPRHGGGEDIDFCLRIAERARKVVQDCSGRARAPPVVEGRRAQLRSLFPLVVGRFPSPAPAPQIRVPRRSQHVRVAGVRMRRPRVRLADRRGSSSICGNMGRDGNRLRVCGGAEASQDHGVRDPACGTGSSPR